MKFIATIAALAAIATTSAADAAVFSISTGSAAWQVRQTAGASNNGAALGTTTNAVVLAGALPSVWIAAPAGSAWVGQRPEDGQFQNGSNSDGATDGSYEYTLSWNPGGGGSFSFDFAGDNTISSLTVTQGPSTLFSFAGSSITMFSSLINTGVIAFGAIGDVIVTATLINAPGGAQSRNPSGFLVNGSANVDDATAVPLPASAALLPLGIACFAAAARRKKPA
jgi:hypothetical protein